MVEVIYVGVAASAGYIFSGILFFFAGVLFYSASKSGIAELLNTHEKMLTILIEVAELFFLVSLFAIMFEISGNLLYRTLSHVALYATSLLMFLAAFFDYRARRIQMVKDKKEVAARRKKLGVVK